MKLLGLVIKTARAEREHDAMLDAALQGRARAEAKAARAEAKARNAVRLLAILRERLKDWDLDDFPAWAENPDRGRGFITNYPIRPKDGEHIWAVVQAYRNTAQEAGALAGGQVLTDKLKRTGWNDAPL